MSNARIQFSLASEDVWNAYNPQLKEGEIVTVLKANKKVKLVQGKVGGSTYSESTVIWDEDEAETIMSRTEAAAVTATAQANAAGNSASKAAASQSAAATSATNAKASETAAKNSETNAKASETAAKNSATSAASSASTASTQAGKAADSATAAAGSATQASTFATTATDKATAADKSATAADKSATAAAASAVTASDKASEAATSATNAAGSATSAAGAAEEARGLISKAEYGFLQRNTAYAVGDIAYTEQLPAGYYLECVTAGTTGNTEPTFKVGGVTLDGTAEWNVQQSASVASVEDIYIKAGDVINIPTVLYINGTLTGAGKSLNFTIPLIRPIKAKRATLIAGQFLFRQNGNYYCGNATEMSNILDMGSCSLFICQSGLAAMITLNEAKGAQNNTTVALSLKNIKLQFS